MSENRFLFVGNGSYYNRGCEAILRGSVRLIREVFGEVHFVDSNFDAALPPHLAQQADDPVVFLPIARLEKKSPRWLAARVLRRMHPRSYRALHFGVLRPHLKGSKAALSVGGDNYSLDYGIPRKFIDLDRFVLEHDVPLVIWGASVGPFDREPRFARRMHAHLRDEVTAIFVREDRSKQYLAEHGIVENVFRMPDPAFCMEPSAVGAETLGFEMPAQAIGLNISPLMSRYWTAGDNEALTELGAAVVRALRDRLGRPIVLISHVTSPRSNDFALLSRVYEALRDKGGIYLLPETLNAAQTKAVISRLDCLIASRTHATIAAFSTGVPALSLAYSQKAYGINELLFAHTDYLMEPDGFSVDKLLSNVDLVLGESRSIQCRLKDYMETVWSEALQATRTLKGLLE